MNKAGGPVCTASERAGGRGGGRARGCARRAGLWRSRSKQDVLGDGAQPDRQEIEVDNLSRERYLQVR